MEETRQAEKVLQEIGIPPQPKVVLEVFKEIKSPNPSVKKIADLAATDQALSARIIKVINSPFYGRRMSINSIQHALTMLGLKNFAKVVLAASLREALAGGGKPDPYLEKLWRHAVSVAKTAEFISVWMQALVSPEEAYMTGLFHDGGMPLMRKRFANYGDFLKDPSVFNGNQTEQERGVFAIDHALLGSMLAKSWGIPRPIHQAIRYHHALEPSELSDLEESRMWLVLRLSDYIAEYCAWRNGQDTLEYFQFDNPEEAGFTPELLGPFGYQVDSVRDMRDDALTLLTWTED
ncbi:MAG: HDOD domain-containing protein [Magnetococcales bacterium]|nr:HDOD domain-containing protein [Magnetococcales bacterium]